MPSDVHFILLCPHLKLSTQMCSTAEHLRGGDPLLCLIPGTLIVHRRSTLAWRGGGIIASPRRNREFGRACSHIPTLGARGSRPRRGPPALVNTYAPGQVQIEIPGPQEAQQESVCERLRGLRDARLLRPASQLDQARLNQRRVVGLLVELFPNHRPRPHLCHARRAVPATGGGGESVWAQSHPPPPAVATSPRTLTRAARISCARLVQGPRRPLKGTHMVPSDAHQDSRSQSQGRKATGVEPKEREVKKLLGMFIVRLPEDFSHPFLVALPPLFRFGIRNAVKSLLKYSLISLVGRHSGALLLTPSLRLNSGRFWYS